MFCCRMLNTLFADVRTCTSGSSKRQTMKTALHADAGHLAPSTAAADVPAAAAGAETEHAAEAVAEAGAGL